MYTPHTISESTISKYWGMIKDAPNDVKLKLISLLSESLSGLQFMNGYNKDLQEKSVLLKKVKGAWKDDKTPEEIIDLIRENRSNRPPVDF